MKTGLVLEGGGMRGIYTAGVLDVLDEAGLPRAKAGIAGEPSEKAAVPTSNAKAAAAVALADGPKAEGDGRGL